MTGAGLVVRQLGLQAYEPVFLAMKSFTDSRTPSTLDEFWFLQHEPVYTQGRAGKDEYINNAGNIPVVQVDRGGQVTYHGPGQLTVYLLLDIKRLGIGVRDLVTYIESALVRTLAHWGIESSSRADAPGVYVNGEKIAALGLRIRKGCSYHGLNFNLSMDMSPWGGINPCGLGVSVTQLSELLGSDEMPVERNVADKLRQELMAELGYNDCQLTTEMPLKYLSQKQD